MSPASIRLFRPEDEATVRRICLDNAGLPDRVRPDDALFADYWTRYYTRMEPGHAWVAETEGRVVGYLTAAFDTVGYRRAMKRRVLPRLLVKSAFTGTLGERRSRDFLLKRLVLWSRPDADPAGLLERFPGHLHVNLAEGARGSGAGTGLVEACLERARSEGLPGMHLETLPENNGAVRFFTRLGFSEIARRRPFAGIDPALNDLTVVVLGRAL